MRKHSDLAQEWRMDSCVILGISRNSEPPPPAFAATVQFAARRVQYPAFLLSGRAVAQRADITSCALRRH